MMEPRQCPEKVRGFFIAGEVHDGAARATLLPLDLNDALLAKEILSLFRWDVGDVGPGNARFDEIVKELAWFNIVRERFAVRPLLDICEDFCQRGRGLRLPRFFGDR